MITYTVFYYPEVTKKLRKLTPTIYKKVLNIFDLLQKNPKEKGLNPRKLSNTHYSYLIRIGNIRIVYEISPREKKVYIWEVEIRGNIY